MLSLLNNVIRLTKYEPTFETFYMIVKGLFVMPPFYTKHRKVNCIFKYFGNYKPHVPH